MVEQIVQFEAHDTVPPRQAIAEGGIDQPGVTPLLGIAATAILTDDGLTDVFHAGNGEEAPRAEVAHRQRHKNRVDALRVAIVFPESAAAHLEADRHAIGGGPVQVGLGYCLLGIAKKYIDVIPVDVAVGKLRRETAIDAI